MRWWPPDSTWITLSRRRTVSVSVSSKVQPLEPYTRGSDTVPIAR